MLGLLSSVILLTMFSGIAPVNPISVTQIPAWSVANAAPNLQTGVPQVPSLAPPPLPRGCISGGTPIDYAQAICCVSGYVYLNGSPVVNALVTISYHGAKATLFTQPGPGTTHPYYQSSLDTDPLNVQTGDVVTITASASGQTKTQTFVAQAGGQQIDIVLVDSSHNSEWLTGERPVLTSRIGQAMAFDSAHQQIILFGGQNSTQVLNDTYTWDGTSWNEVKTNLQPPARVGHAMVYDEARQRVILFGGNDLSGTLFADTWEWDGTHWSSKNPINSPPARSAHTLSYDSERQRIVLYGGWGASIVYNDTWEWDGSDWVIRTPSVVSPKSSGHLMTYDRNRHVTVMFTGGETWEWSGLNWSRKYPTSSPTIHSRSAMYFDETTQLVSLIDGSTTDVPAHEWTWNGSSWTLVATPGLTVQPYLTLAYDTTHGRAVIFTGCSTSWIECRTLERNGGDWSQRAPSISPMGRIYGSLAYDRIRQRAVLFGGFIEVSGYYYINDTWIWDGINWTQLVPGSSPSSRSSHAMTYDEARENTVLFGGITSTTSPPSYSNETWVWDGSTWVQRYPAISPSARAQQMMAYDSARQRVVMVGGSDTGTPAQETWEWDGSGWYSYTNPISLISPNGGIAYDRAHSRLVLVTSGIDPVETWERVGTTWEKRTPLHSPPLALTSLAYDEVRQRTVLFVARTSTNDVINETWEWDGTDWTQSMPLRSPAPRHWAATTYDPNRQRILLFGGNSNHKLASGKYFMQDTWEWDGTQWLQRPDDGITPARANAAIDYSNNGNTLLFGGDADIYGSNNFDNNTYEWQGTHWHLLTPSNYPSGRIGHQLARNANGEETLLFGGKNISTTYQNDTWLWTTTDKSWIPVITENKPPARAYYGLTFDTSHNIWLLFGGQDDTTYFSDTWAYTNSLWIKQTPLHSPPARAHHTLTFDSSRGRAVLVGGSSVDGLYDDIWEWDGSDWTNVTPLQRIPARQSHGATYDSTWHAVVVVGGVADIGVLTDIWEWNGQFWRERISVPSLPGFGRVAIAYDISRQEIMVFGGMMYISRVQGQQADPPPIATINRVNPRDARHSVDTITFEGSGADADASNIISAFRWTYYNGITETVLSYLSTFTLPASALPVGEQIIRLEVQDNEGNWSPSVEQHIYIRDVNGGSGVGKTWTFLIYAVADNNLDQWMGNYEVSHAMLYRLRTAGSMANVNVGILYDGPGVNDTRRYRLDAYGNWSTEFIPEARMDEMETLRNFILWGRTAFSGDYTVLSLVNHANGVVGFGQDLTSDSTGKAFLTPIEIRSALQAATDDGARKIDVLHYDGCSFGLFEDAAIADGVADFVIASPNTGWGIFAYDVYRQNAGNAANPRAYAIATAQSYAVAVGVLQLPYTISVFDMARFAEVNQSISALGDNLVQYTLADPPTHIGQLRSSRQSAQKYDSVGAKPLELDDEDSYVDLADFLAILRATITDTTVISATDAVHSTLYGTLPFVAYERHSSGVFSSYDSSIGRERLYSVALDHATGLGIYYPPRSTTSNSSIYQAYIHDQLFHITAGSGWTRFLAQGLPPQLGWDPPPLRNDVLISPLFYSGPQTVTPPEEVAITGSSTALTNKGVTMGATINPISTTTPVTFTWAADGQPTITAMVNTLEHQAVFTWTTAGVKIVYVTASNAAGTVTTSHAITVNIAPAVVLTGSFEVNSVSAATGDVITLTLSVTNTSLTESANVNMSVTIPNWSALINAYGTNGITFPPGLRVPQFVTQAAIAYWNGTLTAGNSHRIILTMRPIPYAADMAYTASYGDRNNTPVVLITPTITRRVFIPAIVME